jgi:hypothetical protein
MKITMTVGVMVLAGLAAARQPEPASEKNLTVYLENYVVVLNKTLAEATGLAAKMFAGIGLRIRWRIGQPAASQLQQEGAIVVRLATDFPETFRPSSSAFALPYEGVHITVFFDRLSRSARQRGLPVLLAHVLVHEITHMLQGLGRHSDSGIMKAHFTKDDCRHMTWKPLPFAPEDVELIHRGLAARASAGRMVAGNLTPGVGAAR